MQCRGMAKLTVTTHAGMNVDDSCLPNKGIVANFDWADMQEIGLRLIARQHGILAYDGVVADS